jgi:hypothetical protein
MRWILDRIERARSDAVDRAWFDAYCSHITEIEKTITFQCHRCIEADPEVRWPLTYSISSAVRLGFRCRQCRRLLKLAEIV